MLDIAKSISMQTEVIEQFLTQKESGFVMTQKKYAQKNYQSLISCAEDFRLKAFSVAGKRQGFEDARGTLFFEIARLVKARRPPYLLLENVPGLLSHNKGATFNTILYTLYELGYHVEWQVLNSKDFGVPQSRKRVYLIGYLDERCAGKILPFTGANKKALVQIV